jgi:hypothetical protein
VTFHPIVIIGLVVACYSLLFGVVYSQCRTICVVTLLLLSVAYLAQLGHPPQPIGWPVTSSLVVASIRPRNRVNSERVKVVVDVMDVVDLLEEEELLSRVRFLLKHLVAINPHSPLSRHPLLGIAAGRNRIRTRIVYYITPTTRTFNLYLANLARVGIDLSLLPLIKTNVTTYLLGLSAVKRRN